LPETEKLEAHRCFAGTLSLTKSRTNEGRNGNDKDAKEIEKSATVNQTQDGGALYRSPLTAYR